MTEQGENLRDEVRLVLVTGPSGAGRSTAINALEDAGFETIDNMPLSLLERLVEGAPLSRPLALGIDVRNRDFSADAVLGTIGRLADGHGPDPEILYLDCRPDILIRRYSETRRRHPLAPEGAPADGIALECALLAPIRERAERLLDTSDLTPHDLRAEIARLFGRSGDAAMTVSIESFSFKRGLPRGVDTVFDVRFLRNPHWDGALRPLTGMDPEVGRYVEDDPRFGDFYDRVSDLVTVLLPAYAAEGKSHFTVGFGCTGGRHRSVFVTEKLAKSLADAGWRVSTRHREMERQGLAPRAEMGTRS